MKNKTPYIFIVIIALILGLVYGFGRNESYEQPTQEATIAITSPEPTPKLSRAGQEKLIYAQIAEFRKQHDRKPTVPDEDSCLFALKRAKDLPQSFEHDGFTEANLRSAYGFYFGAGENLARGATAETLVPAWINSPTHKAILLGDFDYLCVEWITEDGINYYALEAYSE